jgi:hypothetical protein
VFNQLLDKKTSGENLVEPATEASLPADEPITETADSAEEE